MEYINILYINNFYNIIIIIILWKEENSNAFKKLFSYIRSVFDSKSNIT